MIYVERTILGAVLTVLIQTKFHLNSYILLYLLKLSFTEYYSISCNYKEISKIIQNGFD